MTETPKEELKALTAEVVPTLTSTMANKAEYALVVFDKGNSGSIIVQSNSEPEKVIEVLLSWLESMKQKNPTAFDSKNPKLTHGFEIETKKNVH